MLGCRDDRRSPSSSRWRPVRLGHRRFVDDVRVPGMLHAAVLRSPHAHARLVSIDTKRARRPGRRPRGADRGRRAGGGDHPQPRPGPQGHRPLSSARDRARRRPLRGRARRARRRRRSLHRPRRADRIDVVYQPLAACASTSAALGPRPRGSSRARSRTTSRRSRCAWVTPAGRSPARGWSPRAIHLPAADRGRDGNARARGRAAGPRGRRAAPDRLDQVHPHQPDDPGADLRHAAGRAAPDRSGRGRRLRRARRALSRGHPGAAGGHEAGAAREVDREPARESESANHAREVAYEWRWAWTATGASWRCGR